MRERNREKRERREIRRGETERERERREIERGENMGRFYLEC